MQWLQGPNQRDTDNQNKVRREAKEQKKEYLKAKIDELETDSKINPLAPVFFYFSTFCI